MHPCYVEDAKANLKKMSTEKAEHLRKATAR